VAVEKARAAYMTAGIHDCVGNDSA
jgi:hypothetical protein